jgi:hypothetical protein
MSKDINNFINYCRSFYDIDIDNAVYPFAIEEEIVEAVAQHLKSLQFDFLGDSLDRETVRDIICAKRKIEGIYESDFDKAILY